MTKKRDSRGTLRDYKREYERWGASEEAKKDRAARNTARRRALRSGRVHKGDNKDVDHVRGLADGGDNSSSNTRVLDRSKNRGRRQASRKRGSRRNKESWGK